MNYPYNPYLSNPYLSQQTMLPQQVLAEELLAWFLETHAIEVIDAVSSSLGRPVCVTGTCLGGYQWR